MTRPDPVNPEAADPQQDLPHIPLIEDELTHGAAEVKPTWRGWIHAATFPIALVAGIVLIVLADGAAAKISSAVFMASSLLLFGVSAFYHRGNWSPPVKAMFRRIDHSNIFVLIAGSYTPLAICALPNDKATLLLSLVWGGAILGIGFRIFWLSAPRWLYVALYIALGWAAMLYIVDMFQANVVTMALVVIGGLSYTIGAVFYGLKRPNLVPGKFGFHELFHTCTVIAFLCQWAGILIIAMDPVAV